MAKKKTFLVGLDIGGTKMQAVVLGRKFEVIGRARKRTRGDADEFIARMAECVGKALAEADLELADLAGVGVGCPGPTDADAGVLILTPNLGFKDLPLAKLLSKALGKIPVAIDNDVNLGTYGEYHFGAARGGRNVLGVFPGTGIGGGLIIEGRIYRGSSGAAGEIGHMVVNPSGPLCGCGHCGCLEAYAGRLHVAAELAVLAARGQAKHLAASAGADVARIRSGTIAESIAAGDKAVEQVVRREAGRIGVAVASAVNLLSPDTVVLGGGQVEAMGKLFVEEVRSAVHNHVMPFIARSVRVTAAELGDDAVAIGAAKLAAEKIA